VTACGGRGGSPQTHPPTLSPPPLSNLWLEGPWRRGVRQRGLRRQEAPRPSGGGALIPVRKVGDVRHPVGRAEDLVDRQYFGAGPPFLLWGAKEARPTVTGKGPHR